MSDDADPGPSPGASAPDRGAAAEPRPLRRQASPALLKEPPHNHDLERAILAVLLDGRGRTQPRTDPEKQQDDATYGGKHGDEDFGGQGSGEFHT